MDIDKLIAEIHKYFPRHCDPFSIEYTLADETTQRRDAITQRKNSIKNQWANVIGLLMSEAGASGITDHSETFADNFCNYLTYEKKISDTIIRFHVLLSLLAPCHAIIISAYVGKDQRLVLTGEYEEIENELAPEIVQTGIVKKEVAMIDSKLIKSFGTERLNKKNIETIIVPDIATQEKSQGQVNLFDCLFTSELLTF